MAMAVRTRCHGKLAFDEVGIVARHQRKDERVVAGLAQRGKELRVGEGEIPDVVMQLRLRLDRAEFDVERSCRDRLVRVIAIDQDGQLILVQRADQLEAFGIGFYHGKRGGGAGNGGWRIQVLAVGPVGARGCVCSQRDAAQPRDDQDSFHGRTPRA